MELNSNVEGIAIYPAEMGKIKLGEKGKKYFGEMKIRKNYQEKDANGNMNFVPYQEVMDMYAPDGAKLDHIDIKLPFNDINLCLFSRFVQRTGKVVTGKGDGTNFYKLDKPSGKWESISEPTLQLQDSYKGDDKWKLISIFNCHIVGFERVGSVFVQRGTSFNNYRALRSSLKSLSEKTKGQLTEIPFRLSVEKARNSVSNHNQIFLDFMGTDLELVRKAFEIKTEFAKYDFDSSVMEEQLKKLTQEDDFIEKRFNDADSDDEFFPDKPAEDLGKLEDDNDIPDLDKINNDALKEELSKAVNIATDKISKCETKAELNKLRKGLGLGKAYNDSIKGNAEMEKLAEEAIADMIVLLDKCMNDLEPARDFKKELSDMIQEFGLKDKDFRQQFYKNYKKKPDFYMNNLDELKNDVVDYKRRKLNGLVAQTNKTLEGFKDNDAFDDLNKSWDNTDQKNFDEVYSFLTVLRENK